MMQRRRLFQKVRCPTDHQDRTSNVDPVDSLAVPYSGLEVYKIRVLCKVPLGNSSKVRSEIYYLRRLKMFEESSVQTMLPFKGLQRGSSTKVARSLSLRANTTQIEG
jgi:hypothetical protein